MKKENWFRQWNYDYPIKVVKLWGKENKKQIKKIGNIICWLIIFLFVIIFCNYKIKQVVASYTTYANEKQEREDYLATQQFMRELILREQERKNQLDKEYQEKQRIERLVKTWQREKEELDANYQVGNYIYITDLNDSKQLDSKVGQIRKIVGLTLYGTWGECITYNHSIIYNISYREYKEERDKELKVRLKSQQKKKFTSWGLHPSTS